MSPTFDVVCLSHLRWDFVYQRPQHLLSRCAREHRVFYVEEPMLDSELARLDVSTRSSGVTTVVPHLPAGLSQAAAERLQEQMLQELCATHGISDYVLWYYTPMALGFTGGLTPLATVYDCMDELAGFLGAPPELRAREAELLERADVVFAGGRSLHEAKRQRRPSVHLFPSSIDAAHFGRARRGVAEPPDQHAIAKPRLGFFGVVDERLDLDLLSQLAEARPHWQIVVVGPVVKIDPTSLPQRPNLHYLGARDYADLPAYLASWDVALLPFALNDATRYISPTKTLEYLAAGRQVVSTPIHDVVHPYQDEGLVAIAATASELVDRVEEALNGPPDGWLARVDAHLAETSWESTWARMHALIGGAVTARAHPDPLAVAIPDSGVTAAGAAAARREDDHALV